MMDRWQGRVAVVTGASAGIGAAIVENLVTSGMKVVGLARREDKLMALKSQLEGKRGRFYPLKADISKDDDVKSAFHWIKENLGGVDVLVNNAGILIFGNADDRSCIEDWRKMYEVNVFAVGACTKEALNLMKENKVDDGHIININSVASHRLPQLLGCGPYSSSKFASKAITEAVRRELSSQNSKIKVTSISPGFVATEIFEVNGSSFDLSNKLSLAPKDIADAVNYVLGTPAHVQVNELIIRPVGDGI